MSAEDPDESVTGSIPNLICQLGQKITVKYYYFQYKNTFYLYCKNFEISLYLSNHMAGDGTNGEGADQTAPLIRGKQVLSGHFSVQVFSVNKTD